MRRYRFLVKYKEGPSGKIYKGYYHTTSKSLNGAIRKAYQEVQGIVDIIVLYA